MSNAARPGAPGAHACALGWRRDAPPGNYAANHADGTLASVADQLRQLPGVGERGTARGVVEHAPGFDTGRHAPKRVGPGREAERVVARPVHPRRAVQAVVDDAR